MGEWGSCPIHQKHSRIDIPGESTQSGAETWIGVHQDYSVVYTSTLKLLLNQSAVNCSAGARSSTSRPRLGICSGSWVHGRWTIVLQKIVDDIRLPYSDCRGLQNGI